MNKEKLLSLLLCLVMCVSLAACGSTKNADSGNAVAENTDAENTPIVEDNQTCALHLSDTLGDILLDADWFGNYEVIDTPTEFTFDNCTSVVYYNEGCETPYICVYTFPKDGATVESYVESELKYYGLPEYYQKVEDYTVESNPTALMYTCGIELFDTYFYCDCWIYDDGDNIVEVDMYSSAEEVQLGDSNEYVWVPVGYNDLTGEDEESQQFGTFFYGENELFAYTFPGIWMGEYYDTYEFEEWFWGGEFNELPFTEEELEQIAGGKWVK